MGVDVCAYALLALDRASPSRSFSFQRLPTRIFQKYVCVSACTQKLLTSDFFPPKRCLTSTPRRHRQADVQLSLLYPPSPSFSPFGAACVMLCCFPPASSSTPLRLSVCYPSISLVVNIMYIRTFCDHRNVLYIFDHICTVLKSGWNCTMRIPRLVRRADPLFLPPPCPASSFLPFLLRPICLASSFLSPHYRT